jgi:hypothetical protein
MDTGKSIRDRIRDGDYSSKIAAVPAPVKPAVLRRTVEQLTAEELASVAAVKAAWERDTAAARDNAAAIRADEGRLVERFWADVFADHGVAADDPVAAWARAEAWSRGHSGGLSQVLNEFDELSGVFAVVAEHYVLKRTT